MYSGKASNTHLNVVRLFFEGNIFFLIYYFSGKKQINEEMFQPSDMMAVGINMEYEC